MSALDERLFRQQALLLRGIAMIIRLLLRGNRDDGRDALLLVEEIENKK